MNPSDLNGQVGISFSSQSHVTVLGVRVHAVTSDILIQQAVQWAKEKAYRTILYANVHVLNTAYHDTVLRDYLNKADLVYCDGEGVRLSARILNQSLTERMTGADFLKPLCQRCDNNGIRVFFLGSQEGVAARAAETIGTACDNMIIGAHHGYLHDPHVSSQAIEMINDIKPGILFVGMGTPIQERWIAANRDKLKVPVMWAVGALFDYFAGVQPRGPKFLVSHGLEWAYRLWSDPRRLWKRYIIGNPLFLWRVLKQKWNIANPTDP